MHAHRCPCHHFSHTRAAPCPLPLFLLLLRGKLEQVSFLHVYHHIGVFYTCWLIARHAPGGDPWVPTAFNAAVHILMYSYYFLCTIIGDNPKARAKYLWWAKYLTQIQITQFVVYLVCGIGGIRAGVYPSWITAICTGYAFGLLVLFSHFYMKRWTKKTPSSPTATAHVRVGGARGSKKLA